MKSVLTLCLLFLSSVLQNSSLQAAEPLTFKKHEKIAFVGNSLAERMNLFGHFETLVHSRFPEQELKIRNFGWPADEVGKQQRPSNYTVIDDPLVVYAPDTFFCFFGFNESYAGDKDLPNFKQRYSTYLDDLTKRFSKEGTAPRFVLISPIAFESTGHPLQPDGTKENFNLQLYTAVIQELATERNLPFINLYQPTVELFAKKAGAQYTINGIHLNEQGDLEIGTLLDRSLFGGEIPANIGTSQFEQLREAVNDKSWIHSNDYRMLNGWYVYGGRRTYDVETFPLEYKKIRKMAAVRDQYVWDIAQGKQVAEQPDDSNTGELITPPTGLGRHYPRAEPKELKYLTPEECIATMEVPEGMEVLPFASEREFPVLANPCQLNFDNKGRLWVACMPNYPQWRPGDPRPDDRLLIFEDTNNDGKADECKVFYDKLICPTGFEFWNGGVLVVDEPRILFLKDTDGDDRADQVVQLIDGIATDDTHHTMGAWEWSHGGLLHMLEGVSLSTTLETPYGPYRNQNTAGCYVFDPISLKMRRFKTPGYGNPWCFVFDHWGNGIVGDGTNAKQHWASPLSGADPVTRKTSQPIFNNEGMRPAVGSEFLWSRHLPDDIQGQFIYACVINMNGMPRFTMEDETDGGGLTGKRIADLLKSTDKTFRPVDPKIGPDGAIWFGDWCNALIGHMQYSQRDPNRDHKHGRVYRLVNKNKPLLEPVTQADQSVPELLDQLKSYELRTRYRARREIRDRDQAEVLSAVKNWINQQDSQNENFDRLLCEALWIQESFRAVEMELINQIYTSEDYHARAAAIHVLSNEQERLPQAYDLIAKAVHDDHPRVRLEAIRGCSYLGTPESARLALQIVDYPVDQWLDYTLHHTLLALRSAWLQPHLKGQFLANVPENQVQRFEQFLVSLGPSIKAIPHLQVLADASAGPEKHHEAVKSLSALKGNHKQGGTIFKRVCSSCHKVNNYGMEFGPDVAQIFKRIKPEDLRANIIYSIIEPNKDIQKEYQTIQIITIEGKVINGFVKGETEDSLTLLIPGGKVMTLSKDDIEDQFISKVSSMPEGLAFSMAPEEFLDVVEYLTRLNKGK